MWFIKLIRAQILLFHKHAKRKRHRHGCRYRFADDAIPDRPAKLRIGSSQRSEVDIAQKKSNHHPSPFFQINQHSCKSPIKSSYLVFSLHAYIYIYI